MLFPDAKLILFTKAPVPGQAKTRLIPALGDEGAAELQRRMTRHTVDMVFSAAFTNVELQAFPNTQDASFLALLDDYCIELNAQQGNDLGDRMAHAFEQALAVYDYAIIIGTDAPALDAKIIEQAFTQLAAGVDVVLAPAEDGGYALVGLSKPNQQIFTDIDWGTDRVYQQTLQRIQQAQLSLAELPLLWDVDRPEDLTRLREHPQLCKLLDCLDFSG